MAEKTEFGDYLVHGVDLKNRKIYFGIPLEGGVEDHANFNEASVELAIRALHKMSSDAPGKPIELHLSSYGGSVYDALRLHDEILASPCQIKFFGGGKIMSAATFIMVACDERHLHQNATVMIHELSQAMEYSKQTDIKITSFENDRLMDVILDIYEKNSRMPKEFWQDVAQRDLHLSAAEAVSLGLADKLIEPKKRGNLRKVRQAALKKEVDSKDMRKLVNSIYGRIGKVKIPKIELNQPTKEPADPHVVIVKEEMPQEQVAPEAPSLETKP